MASIIYHVRATNCGDQYVLINSLGLIVPCSWFFGSTFMQLSAYILSKQLELLQNNYWCLNIHSVQNHLSESCGLLLSIVLLVSMKQTRQSVTDALLDSSRSWHFPCTDIYLRAYHHCPDHYHTSNAVVTRKRKRRPILCSCPENSELLVHSD